VRLTVIGCSGSGPGPDSPASCYLVEHDGFRLVLDMGNGSFGPLQGLLDPAEIDAIFLTHMHADHCLDIAPFVVWHRYSAQARRPRVPLYAPVAADRRLAWAYDDEGDPLTDVFDFVFVGPGAFSLGPFEVRTARTAHPIECNAIRLEVDGRTLVYTGDTGPCAGVVELARGADILLAEAAHPEIEGLPNDLHLTGRQAGEHALSAGVGKLLITHVPSWVDREEQLRAAGAVFPRAELVSTGSVYEI
jgi:ribonuclease BN (tRNA processing enzyme)